jgi:hypothetical protein
MREHNLEWGFASNGGVMARGEAPHGGDAVRPQSLSWGARENSRPEKKENRESTQRNANERRGFHGHWYLFTSIRGSHGLFHNL